MMDEGELKMADPLQERRRLMVEVHPKENVGLPGLVSSSDGFPPGSPGAGGAPANFPRGERLIHSFVHFLAGRERRLKSLLLTV